MFPIHTVLQNNQIMNKFLFIGLQIERRNDTEFKYYHFAIPSESTDPVSDHRWRLTSQRTRLSVPSNRRVHTTTHDVVLENKSRVNLVNYQIPFSENLKETEP